MKNQMMFCKKTWTLMLALLLLGALAACGAPAEEAGTPPEENEPAAGQQEEASYATYSTQGVAFQVPADWTQAEGTDLFYAPAVRRSTASTACLPWAPMSPRSSTRRWWSTMKRPISSPTSRRRRA